MGNAPGHIVFVCSPYSGDIEKNTAYACKLCRYVGTKAKIPFAPHLIYPRFLREETEREIGVAWGLDVLYRCSELWYGAPEGIITKGMQAEILKAKEWGIPVKDITKEVL